MFVVIRSLRCQRVKTGHNAIEGSLIGASQRRCIGVGKPPLLLFGRELIEGHRVILSGLGGRAFGHFRVVLSTADNNASCCFGHRLAEFRILLCAGKRLLRLFIVLCFWHYWPPHYPYDTTSGIPGLCAKLVFGGGADFDDGRANDGVAHLIAGLEFGGNGVAVAIVGHGFVTVRVERLADGLKAGDAEII